MESLTKTLTIESRAARKARAATEVKAEQPVYVFLQDSNTLSTHHALFLVIQCTRDLDVGQTVDCGFVARETGIDVCDARNANFLETLKGHANLNVQSTDSGVRISRRASFGIVDKDTLLQEIRRRRTGAVMTITKKDLENTYRGACQDLDNLVFSGEVEEIKSLPSVYCARLPGAQASPAARALWHSVTVPKGHLLQDTLVQRRILTKEEIAERLQRSKRLRNETKQRSQAQKQPRPIVVRKVTNTHLAPPEQFRYSE